jgi:hypothetical protein
MMWCATYCFYTPTSNRSKRTWYAPRIRRNPTPPPSFGFFSTLSPSRRIILTLSQLKTIINQRKPGSHSHLLQLVDEELTNIFGLELVELLEDTPAAIMSSSSSSSSSSAAAASADGTQKKGAGLYVLRMPRLAPAVQRNTQARLNTMVLAAGERRARMGER